jgi:hypothetical protein
MQHSTEGVKTVLTVVSLQGQGSDGTWLEEVKKPGQRVNLYHTASATDGQGFSSLYGKGSGWFTNFLDAPGADDDHWDVSADQLSVPHGRVVGYQMRTWGPVDSVRFLFRAFGDNSDGELTISGSMQLVRRQPVHLIGSTANRDHPAAVRLDSDFQRSMLHATTALVQASVLTPACCNGACNVMPHVMRGIISALCSAAVAAACPTRGPKKM